MCGRYTLRTKPNLKDLGLSEAPTLFPRFNIAPSQDVAVVRDRGNGRELALVRWGLVPSWSADVSGGMINARAETAAQKPSFRTALRRRRCLIIADGFYEWQKFNGKKQPYFIRLHTDEPFAFAGLWDRWDKGEPIESCAIITTTANELMKPIHERMPVILHSHDYDAWLNPKEEGADVLQPLLVPYPSEELTAIPVSTTVNNPRHEGPDCIEPAGSH